jgi:hypothetical protein
LKKAVIAVFFAALLARIILSAMQVSYGIQTVTWFPSLSLWGDFYGYYVVQLSSLSHGLIPYRDFAYSYTPLFLYSMLPFFKIGGPVLASTPIMIADSLAAAVVYEIGKTISNPKNALLAGMSYALLPFALVYEGYLWLSNEPMLLFILLSILLYYKDKLPLSAASLAVAIMFKQEAIFVLPAFIGLLILKQRRRAWKPVLIMCAILAAVSLPFLLLSPQNYLNAATYGVFSSGQSTTNTFSGSSVTSMTPLPLCNSSLETSLSYLCVAIPNPTFTLVASAEIWVAQIMAIPLFVLAILTYPFVKSRDDEVGALYAISVVAFLLIFSYLLHELQTYYVLPVYATLLLSCKTKAAPITVIALSTIAMISPAGIVQVAFASGSILATLALEDMSARRSMRS